MPQAARVISDERHRASVLSGLVPHLPESLLPEALEAARAISDESSRTSALSRLAPHLSASLLPEALEAARVISDERHRAYALSQLAPHLPKILPEALEAARVISDERHRAYALSRLATHFSESTDEPAFWSEILSVLACCPRQYFLSNLVNLSQAILALGGMEALRQVVRAIQDVCRQWK